MPISSLWVVTYMHRIEEALEQNKPVVASKLLKEFWEKLGKANVI